MFDHTVSDREWDEFVIAHWTIEDEGNLIVVEIMYLGAY